MFCQNCGAKNEDTSVFCGECGVKLEKEVEQTPSSSQAPVQPMLQPGMMPATQFPNGMQQPQVAMPPKKPISKLIWVMAAEVIAILFCMYAIKGKVEEVLSPERVAEEYFIDMVNGDYSDTYDMLELPDRKYLTKEAYEQVAKQSVFGDVTKCSGKLVKKASGDPKDNKQVEVSYNIKGENGASEYTVDLVKTSSKKYFIFNEYRVVDSGIWVRDIPFYVKKGAKIKVDGKELEDNLLSTDYDSDSYDYADYYDVYVVPYMFRGNHKVEVTLEGYEPIVDAFSVYEDCEYSTREMYFTEKQEKELQNLAVKNMEAIYNAAKANDFASVKNLFTSDEGILSEIQEDFDGLCEFVNNEKIIDFTVDSIDASSTTSESNISVIYSGSVNYYYTDWWSGDKEKREGSFERRVTFRFVNENGKWAQTNLGSDTFYY